MSVHLEKIIIYNFKSYRGEVVFGPINPFTAIIGSNGAGKSNIMDAISFAMCERASCLRVKYLSDLIYGAAVGKPIAQSAHVTAVFVLKDKSSMSFTRTIHATHCEYKISDEVVSAKSYILELNKLGLNVKAKNFLVFQGTVESIVMKSPKEMCQLTEEISTSGELKAEYDRLMGEISKATIDVQYAKQKGREIRAKKKSAVLEKAEADEYETLNNRYLKMKTELQLFELFHLKADMEELEIQAAEKEKVVNKYENDKSLAVILFKQKKRESGAMSRELAKFEQDLVGVENSFRKKEAEFVTVQEQVSFWRRKLDSSYALLANARNANETHAKTVSELRYELRQVEEMKELFIAGMATQLVSQGSSIEFSNSQVEEYLRLKKIAQGQSLELMRSCDMLKEQQSRDQNVLDNEERKRNELENALNKKRIMKEETEGRYKRLRAFIDETDESLKNKRKAKIDLENSISKRKNHMEAIETEFQKVYEQVGDAMLDNDMLSRTKKKAETIQILQGLFEGVHGRIFDLCKPVHSRYNIAVTKVFGKLTNAIVVNTSKVAIECIKYLKEQRRDVEVFLPLDYLKVKPIKEKFRDIKEPRHVRLLYDVLQFFEKGIDKAVLFVTKSTLVCETPEDASTMAYNIDPQYRYDSVSIDGTFYRRDGSFSGGVAELSKRAKVWEEKHVSELNLKKAQLKEELKQISKIPQAESDVNTIVTEIRGLESRLKYSNYSLRDTEDHIATLDTEIKDLENELQLVSNYIASIEAVMVGRSQSTRSIKSEMNNIEDRVFEDFCRSTAITNVRQYESGDLRVHQEQARKGMEFEDQCNRIENLLAFELDRDTQSPISKCEAAVKNAEGHLGPACKAEAAKRIDIANAQDNLEGQRATCKTIRDAVSDLERSVNECRNEVGRIARLIQDTERERVIMLTKLEKKKAEWHAILKDCKAEGLPIPLLVDNTRNSDETMQSSTINQSSFSSIEVTDQEMISLIDFNKLSRNLMTRVNKDIHFLRNEITREMVKVHRMVKSIRNPNLKASEKLHLATEELRQTNFETQEVQKRAVEVMRKFEQLKEERYKRFMNCMEHIAAEVDVIYKYLVKDESAQAILLHENVVEPYLGGINFSCIAPGKRYQPLSNLSGGEKTLAALALLFAIHSFRPAPFFVLDEIDAALDNRNVSNVVRIIRSKAYMAQIIIVSLKMELFLHADALVGICREPNSECPESLMFTLDITQYPESHRE